MGGGLRKTAIGIGFALLLSLTSVLAQAERVVLVRPPEDQSALSELFIRLQGELRMQGFETVFASSQGTVDVYDLQRIAQLAQAPACVALELREGRPMVSLWFIDKLTSKSQALSFSGMDDEDAPSVLPLRTVDLLRAGLLERREPELAASDTRVKLQEPDQPTKPRLASSPEDLPKRRLPFSARVASGASYQNLKLGPAFGFEFSAGRLLTEHFELAFVGALPLDHVSISAPKAIASVKVTQFGAEIRFQRELLPSRLSLEFTGGAGAAYVSATSEAQPSLTARRSSGFTAVVTLGVGAWYKVGGHFQLGTMVHAVGMLREPVIQVDNRLQTIGRPMVLASLGCGLLF